MKKMQLSNGVTFAKNTPHNSDYVDCLGIPGSGILGKIGENTGGSRGLGRAFAQALLVAGAHVSITARLGPELHETAAQLSSAVDQVVAFPADAIDPGAAPKVVAAAEECLGPITLLINNAGQSRAVGRSGRSIPTRGGTKSKSIYEAPFCIPTPCSQVCSHAAADASRGYTRHAAIRPNKPTPSAGQFPFSVLAVAIS